MGCLFETIHKYDIARVLFITQITGVKTTHWILGEPEDNYFKSGTPMSSLT